MSAKQLQLKPVLLEFLHIRYKNPTALIICKYVFSVIVSYNINALKTPL